MYGLISHMQTIYLLLRIVIEYTLP